MDEVPIHNMVYTSLLVDEALLPGMIKDLAQGIHSYDVIAERYGVGSAGELFEFLKAHPPILRQVKRYRAAYESDEAVHKRIRLKAGLGVEETIPELVRLINNENTPTSQKIEGFHKLSRTAGTDGGGAEGRGAIEGDGATRFNLNFFFSDGRTEQLSAKITPPTIEN